MRSSCQLTSRADKSSERVAPPLRGYSGYVTPDRPEWLDAHRLELYNRLYVTVDGSAADDQHALEQMAERIENRVERSGLCV
jgi:hypothetical protein